jgi:hypothetical protein
LALHDPPIDVPFIDLQTGMVTRPWQEWLIITKRDKANRVENSTANNLALLDSDGHPVDGGTGIPDAEFVGTTAAQELANKTFAELVGSKLLASDGSGGLSETDLYGWIEGTSGRITVTNDGDGTVTLTVPLKANFGITSDANGLSLIQQTNVSNASTSHLITDPSDTPADADALRDDLVTNTIPDIESSLNSLGSKINSVLALLLASEIMAGP